MDHLLIETLSGSVATIFASACWTIRYVCRQRRLHKQYDAYLAFLAHAFEEPGQIKVLDHLVSPHDPPRFEVRMPRLSVGRHPSASPAVRGEGRESLPEGIESELEARVSESA